MLTKSIALLVFLISLVIVNSHDHNRQRFGNPSPLGFSGGHHSPADFRYVNEICANTTDYRRCTGIASRCYFHFELEGINKTNAFCRCKDTVPGVYDFYTSWVNTSYYGIDICSIAVKIQGSNLPGFRPSGFEGIERFSGLGGIAGSGGFTGGDRRPGGDGKSGGNRRPEGFEGTMAHNEREGEHRHGGHNERFTPQGGLVTPNPTDFITQLYLHDVTMSANFNCCMSTQAGLFDSSGTIIISAWKAKAMGKPDGIAESIIYTAIDHCASLTPVTCDEHAFMHCTMQSCYEILYANISASATGG